MEDTTASSAKDLQVEDLEPSASPHCRFEKQKPEEENEGLDLQDRAESAQNTGGAFINLSQIHHREFTSIAMPGEVLSNHSFAMDSFATAASTLSLEDFCKICHCGRDVNTPLIAPCFCAGSLKYVHQECLQRWIKSSDIKRCELCKYPFTMQSKVKPFCQWEKLDMTSIERRKLFCSVTFHIIAITCVVWSLYVLIDRTATEIKNGQLQWPFWTKLVVVAIGFTGGLVFMYIQCKVYVHLCRKWKAYNRIIVVQEVPEGVQRDMKSRKSSLDSNLSSLPNVNSNNPGRTLSGSSSARNESGSGRSGSGHGLLANVATSQGNTDAQCSSSASSAHSNSITSPVTKLGESASSRKTNADAETQTALRGVSIKEVIRANSSGQEECVGANSNNLGEKSAPNEDDCTEITVVTVSKILEGMTQKEKGAIFFTECDTIEDEDDLSVAKLKTRSQSLIDQKDDSSDFCSLIPSTSDLNQSKVTEEQKQSQEKPENMDNDTELSVMHD